MSKVAKAGGAVFLIDDRNGDDIAQLQGWLLAPVPGFVSKSAQKYINIANISQQIDEALQT